MRSGTRRSQKGSRRWGCSPGGEEALTSRGDRTGPKKPERTRRRTEVRRPASRSWPGGGKRGNYWGGGWKGEGGEIIKREEHAAGRACGDVMGGPVSWGPVPGSIGGEHGGYLDERRGEASRGPGAMLAEEGLNAWDRAGRLTESDGL